MRFHVHIQRCADRRAALALRPGLSGVGVCAALVAGRAGAGAASGAGAGDCGRRGHLSHRAMVVAPAPPGAALLELQSN